jgi:CheY-like chemotaxis protein
LLAKNGREAVEIFQQDSSKIITVVLDITMPVMGGQEASRLIREIRPEVPILMSSGYGEAVEESPGEGATSLFIQKPYSAGKLVESIRDALRQS